MLSLVLSIFIFRFRFSDLRIYILARLFYAYIDSILVYPVCIFMY